MRCPSCGAVFMADPGHTCPTCGVALEAVPRGTFPRRRSADVTRQLAPEAVAEDVTARLQRLATEDGEKPAPERVVYSWPDDPRAAFDDDEDTEVH